MFSLIAWLISRGFFHSLDVANVFRSGPKVCVGILPVTDLHILYEALVCGVDLPPGEPRQLFIDTGLIHVMVVSGSHLVFIEGFIGYLPMRLRLALLATYSYLVGFQAPVVRALVRRAIGPGVTRRWGLTSLQVEAATAITALLLYPPWLLSRSFLMSWMCGLAMCAPPIWPKHPHWDLALKCYLFLLPFTASSPLTIGWNALLAPFIGILLFPACVLAMIIPPLHVCTDFLWIALLRLLHMGPQSEPMQVFFSAGHIWWVPVVVHLTLLVAEVQWRRAHAFSYS